LIKYKAISCFPAVKINDVMHAPTTTSRHLSFASGRAPLTQFRGDDTMMEMAASLSLALGEAAETLRHGARMLQEIADLAPE